MTGTTEALYPTLCSRKPSISYAMPYASGLASIWQELCELCDDVEVNHKACWSILVLDESSECSS